MERRMTGAERAIAAAEDPDGYYARCTAESQAAALAYVRDMDVRRRAAFRRRILGWLFRRR